MTRRTGPPPQPDAFAQAYVNVALDLIRREAPASTAALGLCMVVGAGWGLWQLGAEPQLLAKRSASGATLAGAARDLVRSCVGQLDVEAKSWLLEKMDPPGGREEQPGAQPSHFQIALDLDGLEGQWQLRVSAHARGGSVTVAKIAGVVESVAKVAA